MKLKRIFIGILLSAMMIAFTGCAESKIGADIKVNKDLSTESKIRIEYDAAINQIAGGGILKSVLDTDKFNIEMYKEDNKFVEEATCTTEKVNSIDKIKLMLSGSMMNDEEIKNDFITAVIEKKGGFIKNKYSVSVKLNKDYYGIIDDTIDSYIGEQSNNSLANYIGGGIKSKVSSIPFDVNIELPIKITESNGVIGEDGKSVSWNYTLKDLNTSNEMTIAFTMVNIVNAAIIIVAAIIIIAVAAAVSRKRRFH